jgi:organic hydroperoxide reductase OsmC/OhrA
MKPLPHHYLVSAEGGPDGPVQVAGAGLPSMATAAPADFGGPGDQWSPETLITAAVADCFILTFRAIARASALAWISLRCEVEGLLERIDGAIRFTGFTIRVRLVIAAIGEQAKAERLLDKAEQSCLITNSLRATTRLESSVSAQ